MADPNDPTSQPAARVPDTAGTGAPEPAEGRAPTPEIIDAEVVDEPPAADRAGTSRRADPDGGTDSGDSEAFRQYQQFLEFRKFQEWQRLHGDGTPGAAPGAYPGTAGKRPWWKRTLRLLRFKLVRRLLYVALILLMINAGVNYYLGDGGQERPGGSGATGQRGDPGASPVLPGSPKATIIAVYDFVATKPDAVCVLLTPKAEARFARHHGSPDCSGAASALHERVADPMAYKVPEFTEGAIRITGTDAVVSSCALGVRGGPRLGRFGLERRPQGGWIINGHEREPACAP